MTAPQLFPKPAKRMRQAPKDFLREQLATAANEVCGMSDDTIDTEDAWAIAEGIVSRRLARGWSRQTILASIEGGPTPCGTAFYIMRSGVIAVARFAMTQISDMNGRGCWFSIRDLFPPLPVHTHASTEELQPFQVGDKVWAWYKHEPNADCGQPDRPGADADWHRCVPLFTVKKVSGPHHGSWHYAGRPHYQVHLWYREGPAGDHYDAGSHDVCPIKGRPWQMRGDGDYLQLVSRAAPSDSKRRAVKVVTQPAPALQVDAPAQLSLFA
ncbi:hypothetical protein [Stenotrophomonas sp.]|uniref:hypothetical protein n=1 Tax=Stenotrophomonas sp. TaxID=69392 RepID=UPI0028B10013|nr:hypothetical protein [Stenotrophomonas sp.]